MAFQLRSAAGYTCGSVTFCSGQEYVYTCGNSLVIRHSQSGAQRLLKGTALGIQAFAVCSKAGLLAVADKGISPAVHIYSTTDLQELCTLQPGYGLGVAALAFSADGQRLALCGQEPDTQVSVYTWQTREVLVSAGLPAGVPPATQISFHPYDPDRLLTTGGGLSHTWHIQRLWDKLSFKPAQLALGHAGQHDAHTAHAWCPAGGAYVGTAAGRVYCVASLPTAAAGNTPDSALPSTAHTMAAQASAAVVPAPTSQACSVGPAGAGDQPANDTTCSTEGEPAVQQPAGAGAGAGVGAPWVDALGPGHAVTALCLTRDLLVVGGMDAVAWLVHGRMQLGSPQAPPVPYSRFELGAGVQVLGMSMGPPHHHQLAVGCSDGRLLLVTGPAPPLPLTGPDASAGLADLGHREAVAGFKPLQAPSAVLEVDSHVGPVASMLPHPSAEAVVSCGADGTLRVWHAGSGQLLARRTFPSALTAMALAPRKVPLVAVGSEAGVLRLVVLAVPGTLGSEEQPQGQLPSRPLHVAWRCRLAASAIVGVAFNPDSTMLAAACKDNSIWFLSVNPRQGSAVVLGQVQCPETILSIVWPEVQDAEAGVLVSVAGGGLLLVSAPLELHLSGKPSPAADLALGGKEVAIKVVRLEASLLAMAHVPGEKYGELVGLGTDGAVHRVALPAEPQAWAGLKGRVHKSGARALVHARMEGSCALTPSRQLLATGSQDGTLATHTLSLLTVGTLTGPRDPRAGPVPGSSSPTPAATSGEQDGSTGPLAAFHGGLRAGLHDVFTQGTAAISFDHTGRYLVSAGADGSLFLFETQGGGHITRANPTSHSFSAALAQALLGHAGASQDGDGLDDLQEATLVQLARQHAATAAAAARPAARMHSSTDQVVGRLQQLRHALLECVQANEAAPDLEKVQPGDLLINRQLQAQLLAEADEHVVQVKAGILHENAAIEVVAARVRAECWDQLWVRGEEVAGIKDPDLRVRNFPLLQASGHQKQLAQVVFLRRMELLEQRQAALASAQAQAGGAQPASLAAQPTAGGPSAATAGSEAAAAGAGPPGSLGGMPRRQSLGGMELELPEDLMDAWAAAKGPEDVSKLLYEDQEVCTVARKAAQSIMLRQQALNLQQAFNTDWDKVAKQKKADADKIADLNGRMEEIVRELGRLDAPAPAIEDLRFHVPFPEDMAHVLSVRDEEVQVAGQQGADAEGCAAGAGGAGAGGMQGSASPGGEAAAGVAAERALRHMMGGTLAAREENSMEFVLVKPEWMDGNPKFFTEEQRKEVKEFQIKERMLAEEKAKRISVLELELRTVRTAVDDTAQHFDDQLAALAGRRAHAEAALAAVEVLRVELAAAVDVAERSDEAAVREVLLRMSAAKEQRGRALAELNDKKHLLAQMEGELAEISQEDRALDKNFKKEFGGTDTLYPQLLHLYRLRTASKEADKEAGRAGGRQLAHQPSIQQSEATIQVVQPTQPAGHPHISSASTTVRPPHAPSTLAAASKAAAPAADAASTLDAAIRHPLLLEAQAGSLEAWPEVPRAVCALIPSCMLQPGELGPHHEEEPEQLGMELAPDGCGPDLWAQLNEYRARKVRCEREVRRLVACAQVLGVEVPQLEAATASLQAAADAAMEEVQRLRAARKAALHDCVVQLRLKNGQVEVVADDQQLVAADAQQALLLHRSRAEALNAAVRAKGERKVEVLRAIKDFCRGTHMLRWEAQRCELRCQELKHTVRDLQLLHVTRDMQAAYQAGGQEARVADKQHTVAEQACLENLARQRERLHRKVVGERARTVKGMGQQAEQQAGHNTDVARHLVQLQKVLAEQQRLRGSMADGSLAADKKMRRLVTHKKLKEIAQAQTQEIRALSSELDRLRLKTYPTFVEPSLSVFPADTRLPAALQHSRAAQLGAARHTAPAPLSPPSLLPLDRSHPHLNFNTGSPLQ